ncbi:hypothetical protein PG996_002295 [Apiospora saccharicola]|uniref:BTB domain-containing protein n=1 Tax=Apiospora saccharicola TaxID=335842 RepID=A0ABR1WJ24_9PEZI
MSAIEEHPINRLGKHTTSDVMNLDLDMDFDIDIDISGDADAHLAPAVDENEASTLHEDDLTDEDDVCLEYQNIEYPCNTQTLKQGSKVFRDMLQDYETSYPEIFTIPTFSECDSPEVFYATLEVCYSGCWTREQAWELHMSYLSCVKIWLIGHHFGIDAMKSIAVTKAASVTDELTQHFIALPESAERECERAHLASLIRAVKLANRNEWHAGLWKMLYDAGEAVAPKLLRHPVFQSYVKTTDGQEYARAIRATDKVKPKAEMGRGRGYGGVAKRHNKRGGRRGGRKFVTPAASVAPGQLNWHQ